MTNTEKNEVELACEYLENKDNIMHDDDYLHYDSLLKIVIKAVRKAEKMREALRFYADERNYIMTRNSGQKARDVLKECE